MGREFGSHRVGLLDTKDKIVKSADVNIVGKLNSGV